MSEVVSSTDQTQPAAEEKPHALKGLGVDLPNGAKVAGWQLETGGFEWVFTSDKGVKTVLRLSLDAVCAMSEIAAQLLNPTATEAA